MSQYICWLLLMLLLLFYLSSYHFNFICLHLQNKITWTISWARSLPVHAFKWIKKKMASFGVHTWLHNKHLCALFTCECERIRKTSGNAQQQEYFVFAAISGHIHWTELVNTCPNKIAIKPICSNHIRYMNKFYILQLPHTRTHTHTYNIKASLAINLKHLFISSISKIDFLTQCCLPFWLAYKYIRLAFDNSPCGSTRW